MIWRTNYSRNGGRRMVKGIGEVLSTDLGEYSGQDDVKLVESFYLNVITSKIHHVYVDKHGRVPQKRFLHAILAKTNLSQEIKSIVFNRVLYWLKSQNDLQWDEEVGLKRSRNFPTKIVRGLGDECEWPGCGNRENLQLDHKFPFSLGGMSDMSNLQLLCPKCNLQKGSSIYSINSWPTDE